MPENISLIKSNPLLPAEDYVALRKKGFTYIEQSGSAIWTDYNNSDPGITMLEAVCYAITDLAYRTSFEVKDLLAPEQLTGDTWKEIFYTAKQILHNTPLTINDYRKLIIDTKGVRNAWIAKSKDYEVPVWVDYNYPDKRKDDCACKDAEEKLCYGKLGLDAINSTNKATYKETYKKEEEDKLKADLIKATAQNNQEEIDLLNAQITAIDEQRALIPDDVTKLINSKIVEFEGLYNVMIEYEEEVMQADHRKDVRQEVIDKLNRNRNLCEDFLSVNAVEYDDMGIRLSAVLAEYADPDVVLANIFFVIYKYFTPSIPFYTIQQLMDKGYSVDEIFEGPALKHGFIRDEDMEKTDLFRDIRLSDIISEIADIEGVKAITYLYLPFNGMDNWSSASATNFFNKWVQYLQEERKVARIIPEKSEVVFCKERELISYYAGRNEDRRPNRMLKLFRDLKTQESKYKLVGQQTDFEVPAGEYMNLEDYFPVTYSLPQCYGVGEADSLPADSDEKRKIQALQLKGYLSFFEQLLSGYLAQLNHLRDLFSFDDTVQHNAFTRYLYSVDDNYEYNETELSEIRDLKQLLIDYNNHGEDHWDKILHDFTNVLQNLLEIPKKFNERRNRSLNHLLARFSEDMSEYEAISRWLTPYKVEERMSKDKIRMLKGNEYYKISSGRGKAFDYTQLPVWDTPNISGAERRLSRLLGFADATRHTLSPSNIIIEAVVNPNKNEQRNLIKILDADDNETVLLTSVEVKDGCCTQLLVSNILEYADERKYYKWVNGARQRRGKYDKSMGPFWFELYDGTNFDDAILLATGEQFEMEEERQDAFEKLKKAIVSINNNEGLHLIEHILLRPKFDEVLDPDNNNQPLPVSFLNICLNQCDINIDADRGLDIPQYKKKISRTPAAKCYDQLPWVLEYMNGTESVLFQQTFADNSEPVLLKFKRYELLAQRVHDLQEYGSERINYEIVSDEAEDPTYSFVIHGDKSVVLAQSKFKYNTRADAEKEILDVSNPSDPKGLVPYFGFELDLYCEEDSCDNNEDPYSFRTTVVLPCWVGRFRNPTFRNLVEKTIQTDFPAHIHTRIVWLGIQEMQAFEEVYYAWLKEMARTDMPGYEAVNPLIDKLNNLKSCDTCDDDCSD